MNKRSTQFKVVFAALTAMGTINIVQAMGSYGPPPGMPPGQMTPPGQMMPPGQAKQQKKFIKPQIKAQFYQQNPRASDKDWDRYWDNYKRQNGLKD